MVNIRVPTDIKNLSIGGENQPGQLYGFTNDGQTTTISGGVVTASGVRLILSNTATSSSSINNGNALVFTGTLTPDTSGDRLFGTVYTSWYQDSVHADNLIPTGDNITAGDYELVLWLDWGTTDDDNIVQKGWLFNKSGSTQDIIVRSNVRYVINPGSY